ncbi:MAG: hypothetical protein WBP29_11655 [Candidatus Zixiibacteriota bacterium]
MRKILLVIAALTVTAAVAAFGDEAKSDAKKETPKELKSQTLCPVMGGKIDSTVYTDIQGQRVYHCCPMCKAKLKADPDKYFKKTAAEGILFENIQTACPVSGEALEDNAIFSDFEGRRVYFCCNKCQASFAKDPQKYLKKLDEMAPAPKQEKQEKEEKTGHEGHNHG